MPSLATPEEILEYVSENKLQETLEANVIAYFGDLFHAWKEGLYRAFTEGPATSSHTAPSGTASAHNQS